MLCLVGAAHAEGDPKTGKRVFYKCKAYHAVKEDAHRSSPSLYKIVGKPAGAVDKFRYSQPMLSSGLTWDVETLTAFLEDPKDAVPGTPMSSAGSKSLPTSQISSPILTTSRTRAGTR